MAMMNSTMSGDFNIPQMGELKGLTSTGSSHSAIYKAENSSSGEMGTMKWDTNSAGTGTALGFAGPVEYMSGWKYWNEGYYPYVIRESYPVYLQERAVDKGKQAFEILKTLQDLKILKITKVKDFIDAMDAIIKTL